MPHGPAHAVKGPIPANSQGPLIGGGGGSVILAGCPDSMSDMSGSSPSGPILWGVWQSWQPAISTRYLPRATTAALAPACFAAGFADGAAPACAIARTNPAPHTISPITVAIVASRATSRCTALILIVDPHWLLSPARMRR